MRHKKDAYVAKLATKTIFFFLFEGNKRKKLISSMSYLRLTEITKPLMV